MSKGRGRKATNRQMSYIKVLMTQLGRGHDYWLIELTEMTVSEASNYIDELEYELEESQIMGDVLGIGQS